MLLKINNQTPNKNKIDQVVRCLKEDGIIIFPTDSVYALGCNIYNKKSIENICKIKNIKPSKANFSIICDDLSNLSEFAVSIEKSIFKMLKRNLPGPFTFILNASKKVPKIFDNKKKTIGIRIPDNQIAKTIIQELGNPLVATSLHDKDELIEYMTDPEIIYQRFKKLVDIVVDGGYGDNTPSTVVDCTDKNPVILRQGKGNIEL